MNTIMVNNHHLYKQFLINNLSLPFDIIDNIKSFVFYDRPTFDKICFVKDKKREINKMFNNEDINYYSFHDWANNPGLVHTWHVNYYKYKNNYSILFMIEADMCLCCGNYVKSNNEMLPPIHIRCKCVGYTI